MKILLRRGSVNVMAVLLTVCLGMAPEVNGQADDFRNTRLTVSERVELLLDQLTAKEKINFLCADAKGIERLDIPAYHWWNECLHGVARAGKATVFPKPINMGCTWDTALMKEVAVAISDEGRAKYHKALREQGHTNIYQGITFFSPTVNISRDPRWGRNSETFSEDPLLSAAMGTSFILGLQGDDPNYLKTVATPKHFVANNEEDRRHSGSAEVDMKSLREYYFPSFKEAVQRGDAKSVMGAYNALNGVPCCANPFLLTEVLREQWGFDGVVMSDGSAIKKIYTHHHYSDSETEGAAMALKAGCDMSLRNEYRETLYDALEKNLITEEDINTALRRVLELRFKLGMFDPPEMVPYANIPYAVVESEEHRQLALEAARKSIVLLKNEGLLPVQKNNIKKLAVIGKEAEKVYYGDYSGESSHGVSLFDGIAEKIKNENIELLFASEEEPMQTIDMKYFEREADQVYEGRFGLTAEYFKDTDLNNQLLEKPENTIRFNRWRHLPPEELRDKSFSVRWTGYILPPKRGEYLLRVLSDGGVRMYINDELMMDTWTESEEEVTRKWEVDTIKRYRFSFEYRHTEGNPGLDLQWVIPESSGKNSIENVAKAADMAIVFIRDDGGAEGRDRRTLEIQPHQLDLLQRVQRQNKNTVAVISSSTPLLLNWPAANMPGIVYSWIPGQAEGTAIADILFGDENPSAKTSVTFFADENQLPPMDDYTIGNGRSYQYFRGDVLYPFGHGLSYTDYSYKDLKVESNTNTEGINVKARFQVTNSGDRAGEDVVQCYVRKKGESDNRIKQLVAFKRVQLQPGETKQVVLDVPQDQLERWIDGSWQVQAGAYELLIGASSEDIRLTEPFNYQP